MKDYFKELLEYTHYYNQRIAAEILEKPEEMSDKVLKLFSHMINAQQIWNNRIDPFDQAFGVWQRHSADALLHLDQMNFERSLNILERYDPDALVWYNNSSGEAFSNRVKDIFFHVINHATYHRGQIATEFREHGLEPLLTDFIVFKRI